MPWDKAHKLDYCLSQGNNTRFNEIEINEVKQTKWFNHHK